MKETTTLSEILTSELINNGFREIYTGLVPEKRDPTKSYNFLYNEYVDMILQNTRFDTTYSDITGTARPQFLDPKLQSFIQLVLTSTNKENQFVKNYLFSRVPKIENDEWRDYIQNFFINTFWNYQINCETVDLWLMKLDAFMIKWNYTLNQYGNHLEDYLTGGSVTEHDTVDHTASEQNNENRSANNSLPQDLVNLDTSDFLMPYADTNTLSNTKNTNDQTTTHTGTDTVDDYSISTLLHNVDFIQRFKSEAKKDLFILVR